jgi:hypothetical protein
MQIITPPTIPENGRGTGINGRPAGCGSSDVVTLGVSDVVNQEDKHIPSPAPWSSTDSGKGYKVLDANGAVVCVLKNRRSKQGLSDSHLIEHAPTLLKACRDALAAFEAGNMNANNIGDMLHKAIKKAVPHEKT